MVVTAVLWAFPGQHQVISNLRSDDHLGVTNKLTFCEKAQKNMEYESRCILKNPLGPDI